MRHHRSASHLTTRIAVVLAVLAGLLAAVASATAAPRAGAARAGSGSADSVANLYKGMKLPFSAHGSARQVYAVGVPRSGRVELLHRGRVIRTQRADSLGGVLFRNVAPGSGYRVRVPHGKTSGPLTVHTDAAKPWDPKIYNQKIPDHGYGYITTRDGTKLAYTVHPPTSPASLGLPNVTLPAGPDYAPPYPTLIEYSGYGYADPKGPVNGIAVVANLMGFAVVDVNMRGTGCSSGAYDFFEKLQDLDGYDVIQTIARQPWVKDHKVGMMGISYGAISQLFTAQLNPPALEAISPLSTIDATATTLYPGGILNTGFAVAWAAERQQQAEPASAHGGQPYALQQIKDGDTTCKHNQVLHGEANNLFAKIRANSHYRPAVADQLDPITFVHKIHTPVFMACQFEDEQTGGHCPDLAQHFTGTKQKWFTFTNGVHADSLDPDTAVRWYDFLELYVAHQAPVENSAVLDAAAPIIYQQAFGLPSNDEVTLPPDPIQLQPTYAGALAAFKKLPEVRVLFDNGAGTSPTGDQTAGNPYPQFEKDFSRFPAPGTRAERWYLGPKGKLSGSQVSGRHADTYTSNAHALPLTDFGANTGGGGLWGDAAEWSWKWKPNPAGTAVAYVSAPLKHDTAVIGGGAVHLWVKSSTPDVDLLATVSEVYPDGHEVFVQNGYLRASERKLETRKHTIFAQPSTLLEPIPSERAADARPMPRNRFVPVVIPLYYEGHMYRAGSRIRITISAPNGTQPVWSFSKTVPGHRSRVSIAFSRSMPSQLILPVVPGVTTSTPRPPCPSLRNEPCRAYRPFVNRSGS